MRASITSTPALRQPLLDLLLQVLGDLRVLPRSDICASSWASYG